MNPIPQSTNKSSLNLVFLKLGGSLITDKTQPHTPRLDVLTRLAIEISDTIRKYPDLRLILGNGAGSFGHVPAQKYNTRQGVRTPAEWEGFAEVWREAATLNNLVTDALHEAALPAIAIHPSSVVTAHDGLVVSWDLLPLRTSLEVGLLPVIHGDVVFDTVRGATILSTEDLFEHLARQLFPRRILLAGLEEGVWIDYSTRTNFIPEITPSNVFEATTGLGESDATDVTGGMASKVAQSLSLVESIPGLEVLIFSGMIPGNVQAALSGKRVGTMLHS